jgi:translation elongation factor EF-G
VPAAELTTYATDVRAMTHGRGWFRARHDRYEVLAPQLAERLGGSR